MERDAIAESGDLKQKISTHTLTWSVTFLFAPALTLFSDFNSHAHVERDCIDEVADQCVEISTHTLTWSVTIS